MIVNIEVKEGVSKDQGHQGWQRITYALMGIIYHFKCRRWIIGDSWMFIQPDKHRVQIPFLSQEESYLDPTTAEEQLERFKGRLEEMDILRYVDITIVEPRPKEA